MHRIPDNIEELRAENVRLKAEIEQLRQKQIHIEERNHVLENEHNQLQAALEHRAFVEYLIDAAPDGILVVDADSKMRLFNKGFVTMWRIPDAIVQSRSDEAALGYVFDQLAAPEQFLAKVHYLYDHPSESSRDDVALKDGRIFDRYSMPIMKPDQTIFGRVWFFRDITDRLKAEETLRQQSIQEEIIRAQQITLRELSTPLIPIAEGILVLPLIGSIDSSRAQQVMETLLDGVAEHHASMVLIDITGVHVVDTQVANVFMQAAQAVRLLGAQVIITGIQPQIAQTLVQLGVDLGALLTRSSLQAGIELALRRSYAG
ncbi:MAG: STAS domain-containing protein [Chloroflexaceae bacterium]|nr:STAS domain-containing protein [Chloroflexaceae bacterium]